MPAWMPEWLAVVIIKVVGVLGPQIKLWLHNWFFDPVKWLRARENGRAKWCAFVTRARATADDTLDDRRAQCYAALFKFRTLPGDASLEVDVRQWLDAAVEGQDWDKVRNAIQMLNQAIEDPFALRKIGE